MIKKVAVIAFFKFFNLTSILQKKKSVKTILIKLGLSKSELD